MPLRALLHVVFGGMLYNARQQLRVLVLETSTRLGPYEIVALLGAGGMGEVYRARDTRLERYIAIKVLPATFANDSLRVARFEREAKAVASLSHPNILAIHDYGTHETVTYAVMELLEGESLPACGAA
jgi:serine/threonine protein kinase